jgi:hypothetical protein
MSLTEIKILRATLYSDIPLVPIILNISNINELNDTNSKFLGIPAFLNELKILKARVNLFKYILKNFLVLMEIAYSFLWLSL